MVWIILPIFFYPITNICVLCWDFTNLLRCFCNTSLYFSSPISSSCWLLNKQLQNTSNTAAWAITEEAIFMTFWKCIPALFLIPCSVAYVFHILQYLLPRPSRFLMIISHHALFLNVSWVMDSLVLSRHSAVWSHCLQEQSFICCQSSRLNVFKSIGKK